MRLDKTTETLLVFAAIFIILITALYVDDICVKNSVTSQYNKELSLTGSRLSDYVYANVQKVNEWQNAADKGMQFEVKILNNSNSEISNWTVEMKIPSDGIVSDYWNAEVNREGDTMSLTPVEYNDHIKINDGISFGFIVNTNEEYYPESLKLKGYITTYDSNTPMRKIIYSAFVLWAMCVVGFFVSKFNLKNYRERQKNDVRVILQAMNTFISFIDAKDPYTRGHSRRVAMYAAEIAKRMRLAEDEVQNIYYAGLLHDAGKISIPDAVLNKPGKLTEEERKQIQDHTVAGGEMLKQMSSLRGIRETALYHHERYDGKGYPEGLKGDAIPLYARIVGVADSYDAMSSNRVYRRHLSKDEIIEEIQKGSSTQFDPSIVPYMIDMINDGYVNVVKMETAEHEDGSRDFHITEDDIPSVYMGL